MNNQQKINIPKADSWINWSISVTFVAIIFGFQTGYAITNPYIAKSLDLTMGDIGFIGAIYTWVFALTQLMSGSLLDKSGAKRVLPIACIFITIGIFLCANAKDFNHLIIAQTLIAIGASCGFIGAGFVGGQWFSPAKFGILFAWVQFIASCSAFLSQQILSIVLKSYHWSTVINFIGVMALATLIMMFFFLKDPPDKKDHLSWPKHPIAFIGEVMSNIAKTIKIKGMVINFIVGSVSFATILCLGIVWGPKLLLLKGLTQTEANFAVSLSWLGLAFGAPLFAILSNKMHSRKKPLAFSLIMQVVFIASVLVLPMNQAFIGQLLFFLFGLVVGGSMLPFTIGAEMTSIEYSGTSASLVNASQFIIGGVFMSIPGWLLDASWAKNILEALYFLPIALIIAAILVVFVPETAPKHQ